MNRSHVNLYNYDFKIDIDDVIFSIGSCFAEELGLFLKREGVLVYSNPFGTVYNLYSIYKILDIIFSDIDYYENDLCYENGKYFTYEHSAVFDNDNKEKYLSKINRVLRKARIFLKKATVLIITAGTSVVWEYKGKIISNCHKLKEELFIKRVLSYEESFNLVKKIVELVKSKTGAKVIFTVSPVRHSLNDLILNSYSKAILRSAIGTFVDNKSSYYFPSFELVIDELRDYSFYKEDLRHLRKDAVHYIVESFKKNLFESSLISYTEDFKNLKKLVKHRIRDYTSNRTVDFINRVIEKINKIKKKKDGVLLKKIKLKIAREALKLKDYQSKKTLLKKLFNEDNNILVFFNACIDYDIESIKLFKFKNKMLKKIKRKVLFDIFIRKKDF